MNFQNKTNEELIVLYNKLYQEKAHLDFDFDIFVCLDDFKTSDRFAEYQVFNQKVEEVYNELISRGVFKNRIIFPEFC